MLCYHNTYQIYPFAKSKKREEIDQVVERIKDEETNKVLVVVVIRLNLDGWGWRHVPRGRRPPCVVT
jgi:hypothetical protein